MEKKANIRDCIFETNNKLKQPIYTGKRLEENIKSLSRGCFVISGIPILITVMNFVQGRNLMGIMTLICSFALILCGVVSSICKKRMLAVYSVTIIVTALFFFFTISGENEGFAILWTILAPVTIMYFGSVRLGICVGFGYEVLFLIIFFTPLRQKMGAYYSDIFMTRYPILYFCNLLICCAIMIQYHIRTLDNLHYNERLEKEVKEKTLEIEEDKEKVELMSHQMIEALAEAIDAKDKYTKGHSFRVSRYAIILAKKIGLPQKEIKELEYEGLLHDVGKIGVPDAVLNKPGKLTDEEYAIIKSHTVKGADILKKIFTLSGADDCARHHHEKYDGTGYPDCLKGEDIPYHARILALADTYDAMSSNRIYREALSTDVIRAEFVRCRGTQFDPVLCDAFVELIDSNMLKIN